MLLTLLEAAAGHDAPLRNIFLDPSLLGAAWGDPVGKLYPDSKCVDARNIAKLVNDFCRSEWGVGVREALLDNGKPSGRLFREHQDKNVPPHIYGNQPEQPMGDYVEVDPFTFLVELRTWRNAQTQGVAA